MVSTDVKKALSVFKNNFDSNGTKTKKAMAEEVGMNYPAFTRVLNLAVSTFTVDKDMNKDPIFAENTPAWIKAISSKRSDTKGLISSLVDELSLED